MSFPAYEYGGIVTPDDTIGGWFVILPPKIYLSPYWVFPDAASDDMIWSSSVVMAVLASVVTV
ncbi:MAG: hypothetical protein NTU88_02605, partial [Armatimonadetes bacterium]|nr:hypothetical protein [Armatimonadota bacterium]